MLGPYFQELLKIDLPFSSDRNKSEARMWLHGREILHFPFVCQLHIVPDDSET